MIRFGVCTKFDKLELLEKAGYDYMEFALSSLEKRSEEEYAEIVRQVDASSLQVEAFNGFFPADIALVGPAVDMDRIAAYTDKALGRAVRLGGKVAVLGSGKSRNIPEDFPYETAYQQFCEVFDLCANIAGKYGMIVALEPLNPRETNFLTTVAEGIALCKKVNNPHGKCLADFYHISRSGETLDAVRAGKDWIVHTHLADPDRDMPESEADIAICRQWAQALKDCGYEGRMSLEGHFAADFEADITRTRKLLDLFNE